MNYKPPLPVFATLRAREPLTTAQFVPALVAAHIFLGAAAIALIFQTLMVTAIPAAQILRADKSRPPEIH